MLGVGFVGIIEVCNIFIMLIIYFLFNVFMLMLGVIIIFFFGCVWVGDSVLENREIVVWW